jgi:WD40 repeat protein
VAGRFGPNIQRRGDSCPDALLGWTPDAARAVVSRSHGRKLEFWDLQANVRLSSVEHADAPLIGLAVSDSGTTAVTVASDGTFCHWDLFNNGESGVTCPTYERQPAF